MLITRSAAAAACGRSRTRRNNTMLRYIRQ